MRRALTRIATVGLIVGFSLTKLNSYSQIATAAARIVLATVVDASGRTLVDFAVDDFVVSEGGRERELLDVHIADYPILLVLDDTCDSATWATLTAASRRFINRIGERPVAIGLLSKGDSLAADFDEPRSALLERLDGLRASAGAARSTLAAMNTGTMAMQKLDSPFSAVVVVAASPDNNASPPSSELLPAILATHAPIHVVVGRGAGRTVVPGATPADVLQLLADQARGQYVPVFSASSFSVALDRLADRLSSEMMIEFLVPPGDSAGDIRVGVRRPGARVQGLGVSK